MRYLLFFLFFFLVNNESLGKKKINVDGVYYECKSPKNSFERTRGVRNRICFFSKEDKNDINKRIRRKNMNLKRKFIKRRTASKRIKKIPKRKRS